MYRQPQMGSPLVVSAVNGMVRAHEKATGRKAWEIAISQLPVRSVVRLAIEGDRVVGFGSQSVGTDGLFEANASYGVLFMLDYASGRLGWSTRLEGENYSPTLLVEAPHVFLARGAMLFAFDLEGGRLLWHDTDVTSAQLERHAGRHPVALATPARSVQGDGF